MTLKELKRIAQECKEKGACEGNLNKLLYFIDKKDKEKACQILLFHEGWLEDKGIEVDFKQVSKTANNIGTCWHSNGQLEIEATYKDGKVDGFYKEWHSNGQLHIEATYKDGQKHGQYKKWYENGQPYVEATYKDGVKLNWFQSLIFKLKNKEVNMSLGKDVKLVSVQEWDELVEKTYGRPYSFQQQDGCKDRGIFKFSVPINLDCLKLEEEKMNDYIPEISDSNQMGVKFDVWLSEHPSSNISTRERLFWKRRFYPNIYTAIDDLYKKGLIEKGNYVIDIDW